MSEVSIVLDNKIFTGWQSVTITQDITAFCNTFKLSVGPTNKVDSSLFEGKSCEIKVGNLTVLTGYVEIFKDDISKSSHTITLGGRDKLADLVDCNPFEQPSEYNNVSIKDISSKLCEPFNVNLSGASGGNERIVKYKVDSGQKIHEVLEVLGRKYGYIFRPTFDGELRLLQHTSYRTSKTQLIEGQNLKSLSYSLDYSKRYSRYIVKAQNLSAKGFNEKNTINITRTSVDKNAPRYRPLVITSVGSLDSNEAQTIADWYNCLHRSKSYQIGCQTQGWFDSEGVIWQPATLLRVHSKRLDLDKQLLISKVILKLSKSSGTTCDLTLSYPDAFVPKPIFEKKNHKRDK